jgi:Protein of unknown function (DUF3606)
VVSSQGPHSKRCKAPGSPGNRGQSLRVDLPNESNDEQGEAPMADDRMKRGAQDRRKISIDQEHEVRYWTQELGVSEAALTAAVAKVGTSVEAVRRELHRGL